MFFYNFLALKVVLVGRVGSSFQSILTAVILQVEVSCAASDVSMLNFLRLNDLINVTFIEIYI